MAGAGRLSRPCGADISKGANGGPEPMPGLVPGSRHDDKATNALLNQPAVRYSLAVAEVSYRPRLIGPPRPQQDEGSSKQRRSNEQTQEAERDEAAEYAQDGERHRHMHT
jgi:hypothetical protein